MNDERLNVRVGAVTILLLIAAIGTVLGLEGKHIRRGMRIQVALQRAGVLHEGAKVRVSGRTIGTVERVRLVPRTRDLPAAIDADPDEERAMVMLDVWIDKRYAWLLHDKSEFFVSQAGGLLGDAYLEVGPGKLVDGQPPPPGAPLRDGALVRGVDPPRMDRVMQKSYENLITVTRFLREGMPEASELIDAVEVMNDELAAIDPTPGAARTAWEKMLRLRDEARLLVEAFDQTGLTPERLARTRKTARALIARGRSETALLERRIDSLTAQMNRIDGLDLASLARYATIAIKARELQAKVDRVVVVVEALVALVDAGEGTIGAFMHDKEMADDLKAMSKLMKEQPWRTLGHPGGRDR